MPLVELGSWSATVIRIEPTSSPRIRILSAASLADVGMVSCGVFGGRIVVEIMSPAVMLPMASRRIGLVV